MMAFVTASDNDAINAINEWSKNIVVPVKNKYQHENIFIDADLVASVLK